MSRIDPPAPKRPLDVEGTVRAFMEMPVAPLAPDEAKALRARIAGSLERGRARPSTSEAAGARARRWRPWVLFAAAACLPIAIWALASRLHGESAQRAETATVRSLAGNADIARGSVERSIVGMGDAALAADDELRTGEDAAARASLPTGAVVDVGPWARVRFSATGSGASLRDRIELVAGRIQVQVPELSPGSELRVHTSDATVVVHGTKFSVDRVAAVGARPAGTRVSVTEGVVTVDTEGGQRTLTAGMELTTPEPAATDETLAPLLSASGPDASSVTPGANTPSTLGAENGLLSEAMRLRRDRHDDRALALLDAFSARYPRSPLTETVRVERLRVLEETGATGRLGREAERYLADYPRGYARQEASTMLANARGSTP